MMYKLFMQKKVVDIKEQLHNLMRRLGIAVKSCDRDMQVTFFFVSFLLFPVFLFSFHLYYVKELNVGIAYILGTNLQHCEANLAYTILILYSLTEIIISS